MKAFWIMGFALALNGCGLQPAVTVTVGTGTTFTDHRISYASGQDCAKWRVLDGLAVCKDDVAAVQSAGARDVPALAPERPMEIVGQEAHHVVLDGAS